MYKIFLSPQVRESQGKPITVTHPEITRYFMSISEAVRLVMRVLKQLVPEYSRSQKGSIQLSAVSLKLNKEKLR